MMIAIAILSLSMAFGQENGNRDDNNAVIGGPYLTNNALFDNSFIGIGEGINTFYTKDAKFLPFKPGINVEGFIGKWFMPSVGVRVGYKGITNFINETKYWQHYVHGDFMWNISNALGGYKETRFWELVPYMSAGVFDINKPETKSHNLEYGAGVGIYNKMRLTDRVNLYVDINTLVLRANAFVKSENRFAFAPSVSFGIVFNLGRYTGFKRHSSVIASYYNADEYNNAIALGKQYKEESDSLGKSNKELKSTVDSLNGVKPEIKEVVKVVEVYNVCVYFEKGKYNISEKELSHIIDFANSVDKDSKITIIGSADSNEGSVERNKFLSEQRAEVVKNVLVEKYSFKPENITIETTMDAADTPERSRVAIVK